MAANRWRVLVGGALLAALVGTACSSSGSSGSSAGSTSTSAPNEALLGPINRATGAPLKIGFIDPGTTATSDSHNEIAMAKATVQYVNEHLGGVAGRPIALVLCGDNTTPSGSTDCANQMLAAKVPVVLEAEPAQPAPILQLLAPAKVPFMTWAGADATLLTSPDAFVMGNPLTLLAAPVKVGQTNGTKKIAMVYVNVPAAAQLPILAKPMYKKFGIDLLTSAVPLGAPDVTPQIQAEISSGADEFLVIGDDSLCINSLKALKTLGFKGTVFSNDNCLKTSVAKALPGGFDGLIHPSVAATTDADPEVKLYHAVAAKYAPGVPADDGTAPQQYTVIIGFVRAMKDLKPGDTTAAGITTALLTMSPQPMPLLGGQTFQCDRKKSPLTPAVCSNGSALEFLDAHGNVTKLEAFDATPYMKLS
jgi:branched-chain amino acid transport system substrate-binding protein